MSTKFQTQTPIVPIIVTTSIAVIGLVLIVLQAYTAGGIALVIGAIALGVTLLAHRRDSTTLERVITLSPRDERDSAKIQWGFALVGKITYVFMTLLGLATLGIFGASGLDVTECTTVGETYVCNVTGPALAAAILTGIVAFFALVLLTSAIVSSFKRY